MTETFNPIHNPDQPHLGEVGLHLAENQFRRRGFDRQLLNDRSYRLAATLHSADIGRLYQRCQPKLASPAGWVEMDQLAHLYNIVCRRSEYAAPGYEYRRPLLIAAAKRVIDSDDGEMVHLDGVLMFGNGNGDRLAYMVDTLVREHPQHRSTLITELSATAIGSVGSLGDAIHEVIAPPMGNDQGAVLRVFDRIARRQISNAVAAAAGAARRARERQAISGTQIFGAHVAPVQPSASN